MSRSEEDSERTPLVVYEDRVGSSSFSLIEEDPGRRRRRYICIGLTTVCLGVGLVLAVTLPLTTMSPAKKAAPNDPVTLLAMSGQRLNVGISSESEPKQEQNGFSDQNTHVSTTAANDKQNTSAVSSSSAISEHSDASSAPSTASSAPSTASPTPDPFSSCMALPRGRRSAIDVDQLNGQLFFELYRVQTRDFPGYASGLSCSVMELDFGTNATLSKNGTMSLKWMERGFILRYPRTIKVNLERSQESPYDWTETLENQPNAKGRLSFLVQIGGFLLAYECFPTASYYPGPAYAIRLYSMVPYTGSTYIASSLMSLANFWGLNPAEERLNTISHRFCSLAANAPR